MEGEVLSEVDAVNVVVTLMLRDGSVLEVPVFDINGERDPLTELLVVTLTRIEPDDE